MVNSGEMTPEHQTAKPNFFEQYPKQLFISSVNAKQRLKFLIYKLKNIKKKLKIKVE